MRIADWTDTAQVLWRPLVVVVVVFVLDRVPVFLNLCTCLDIYQADVAVNLLPPRPVPRHITSFIDQS